MLWCSSVTTCAIWINVVFTRYSNKHPCPTWSVSASLRIRYTSIRRNQSNSNSYLYPRLAVFESESDKKCEINKILTISVRIRSVYIPSCQCIYNVFGLFKMIPAVWARPLHYIIVCLFWYLWNVWTKCHP